MLERRAKLQRPPVVCAAGCPKQMPRKASNARALSRDPRTCSATRPKGSRHCALRKATPGATSWMSLRRALGKVLGLYYVCSALHKCAGPKHSSASFEHSQSRTTQQGITRCRPCDALTHMRHCAFAIGEPLNTSSNRASAYPEAGTKRFTTGFGKEHLTPRLPHASETKLPSPIGTFFESTKTMWRPTHTRCDQTLRLLTASEEPNMSRHSGASVNPKSRKPRSNQTLQFLTRTHAMEHTASLAKRLASLKGCCFQLAFVNMQATPALPSSALHEQPCLCANGQQHSLPSGKNWGAQATGSVAKSRPTCRTQQPQTPRGEKSWITKECLSFSPESH